jgi:ketosteroid isomerase-like protein
MHTTESTITTSAIPMPVVDDPKVAAVQRLYAAVFENDLDAILAELADDVDWAADTASASVPWYGSFRGKATVPGFFEALGTNIEITEFTPLGYASNDTDVNVPVRFAYTVRATGASAEMTMQHWWRFADGKIVFFRGAEDSDQSAHAFGASDLAGGTSPLNSDDGPRGGGPVPGQTPPADPKVATILDVYDAFRRQDLATVLAHVTDDVDWGAETKTHVAPWYGVYRGKEELPAFFQALATSVETHEFLPLSITVNETDVMVVIRWSVTTVGTGTPILQHLHHWWRFEGDKIAFYRGLDDRELVASAFA